VRQGSLGFTWERAAELFETFLAPIPHSDPRAITTSRGPFLSR
jgi:hypothetical protein